MTMRMAGVRQEMPNNDTRKARIKVADAADDRAAAERRVERLKVRQSMALAWISSYSIERKVLIVAPLLLVVVTEVLSKRTAIVRAWSAAWAWLPVPAMAAALIVVVGSQIMPFVRDIDRLAPVIPVYMGFLLLAPLMGGSCIVDFQVAISQSPSRYLQCINPKLSGGFAAGSCPPRRGSRPRCSCGDYPNTGGADWGIDLHPGDTSLRLAGSLDLSCPITPPVGQPTGWRAHGTT